MGQKSVQNGSGQPPGICRSSIVVIPYKIKPVMKTGLDIQFMRRNGGIRNRSPLFLDEQLLGQPSEAV
jgi:hypothetical protein